MKIDDLKILIEAAKKKSPFSNTSLLAPGSETAINLQRRMSEIRGVIERLENTLKSNQSELKKLEKQLNKLGPQSADSDVQSIASKIQNDCGKFLMAFRTSGELMYRGIRGEALSVFQATSPTNRVPVDSDPDEVAKFNSILSALKIEANRSNSIFVTSEEFHARDYGTLYVIIPKNSAKFSWSAEEKDLIIDSDVLAKFVQLPFPKTLLTKEIKKIQNAIDKLENLPKNVNDQIGRHYVYAEVLELLIEGDTWINSYSAKIIKKYFPDSPLIPYLDQLTGRSPKYDLKSFQDKYKMKNDSLISALKMGHEILIHGEYYAIHYNIWSKFEPILIGKSSKRDI